MKRNQREQGRLVRTVRHSSSAAEDKMMSKMTPDRCIDEFVQRPKKSQSWSSSLSSDSPIKYAQAADCFFKGTVSQDYKCLEVISIKSPLLGHVTPDI